MKHKIYGAEAQLPPLHPTGTEDNGTINQIMERVDIKNDYSQELQRLQSMMTQLVELHEKMVKKETNIRSMIDVMNQLGVMLSKECEGLSVLQKQVRSQVAEMCQKSIPISIPDDVNARLNQIYSNYLNDTKENLRQMQIEYQQSIQKQNEKFLSDLSLNKGVWFSRKVFWWVFGIFYGVSLLGMLALFWEF